MLEETSAPKRRAWPVGLLLSIGQIALVWLLGTLFGRYVGFISGIAFCVHVLELIIGAVWWEGKTFEYPGRVLVFTALFPVAFLAVLLLVWSGFCLMQGKGIGR